MLWKMKNRIWLIVRVQKGRFSAPKLMLPMCVFSKRLSWMKIGTEERSVGKTYVSTWNVSEGNILRKHPLRPGWIQDSMPNQLPDLLRDRYRIYSLSAELMNSISQENLHFNRGHSSLIGLDWFSYQKRTFWTTSLWKRGDIHET